MSFITQPKTWLYRPLARPVASSYVLGIPGIGDLWLYRSSIPAQRQRFQGEYGRLPCLASVGHPTGKATVSRLEGENQGATG